MHDQPVIPWLTREQVYEKLVSYAQNHEDVLLHRAFRDQATGFYVDIGANDPVFHSVTKLFYDRGWSGLNVEPNPSVYRTLREGRPRDVNLNIGVSDREGILTFHEVPAIHGWSTFMPDLAERFRRQGLEVVERPVAVTTLVRLCERHVDRTIDFLKVDAEGSEREIFSGFDLRRWRPRVIVVEAPWPELWDEGLVLRADYLPAAFDGLNRYYVRAEEPGLVEAFRTPVNVTDNFIPHEYVRLLDQYAGGPLLGATTLALARRAQRLATRHPRASALVRRLVRSDRRPA